MYKLCCISWCSDICFTQFPLHLACGTVVDAWLFKEVPTSWSVDGRFRITLLASVIRKSRWSKKEKPAKTKRLDFSCTGVHWRDWVTWSQVEQFKWKLFEESHGRENGFSCFVGVISNNGGAERRWETNHERKLDDESLRLQDVFVFQVQSISLPDTYEIVMLRLTQQDPTR